MAFKNLEIRVEKGNISFAEIAEVLDVHPNTVNKWFNSGEMDELRKRMVLRAIDEIKQKKAVR